MEEVIENSVSGESRRGGEDKVLDDLEKVVLKLCEIGFISLISTFMFNAPGSAEDLREVRG